MPDQISQMWAVATEKEGELLQDLAARAGLRWECRSCSTMNVVPEPGTEDRCAGCGERRSALG